LYGITFLGEIACLEKSFSMLAMTTTGSNNPLKVMLACTDLFFFRKEGFAYASEERNYCLDAK
jgi:hypothetical protein